MNKYVLTFENTSNSPMDSDYMDELLSDECWLQTTNGSEIVNINTSPSNPFDSSFQWPKLEPNIEKPVVKDLEEDMPKSNVKDLIKSPNTYDQYVSESCKQWWSAPISSFGSSLSVIERLFYVISNIKRYAIDKHALIQVWLPETTREGNKVLSTSRRLFSLDLDFPQLSNYRNVSENYHFRTEGDVKDSIGLPGRVFMQKVPEWTPDVRLFKVEEYSRVSHAQEHDVRGSFAVPVFDQDVKNCIGVVEVVMTTQRSKYTLEIQSLCKALEAVDLMSSEDSSTQKIKASDGFYHPSLPDILETLKCACMIHNLPLAQTWIPCIKQGSKGGCRHSNENLSRCISTVDSASYVSDQQYKDFQEACSEHHLFLGQGVVGKAFTTNELFSYSPDVTSYLKTEYPLAHHAKIFDLHAAVAIRVRTIHAATVDFVLEFFLPVDCKNREEQKKMINSLLVITREVCGSVRIVAEMGIQEEGVNTEPVPKVQETDDHGHGSGPVSGSGSGLGSGSGSGSGPEIEKRRPGPKLEKTITLELIRQQFAGSLKEAARNIGVCPTTLKRICRQHGIQRWPSRKIKKVGHSLKKIQLVMESIHGGSSSIDQIGSSFYSNFPKLASPNPSKPTHYPFPATNAETFDSKPTAPTLCISSSSSGPSSSGDQTHNVPVLNEVAGDVALKRTKSDADIYASNNQDQEPKIFPRSQSHTLLREPLVKSGGRRWSVKVTFGEEKARFRMQKDWGYCELLQEIAKRFCLSDISRYQLKYLDDDSEWVLITCDGDVEECLDVYRSFINSGTIRLTLREPRLRVGSSLGSNMPLVKGSFDF